MRLLILFLALAFVVQPHDGHAQRNTSIPDAPSPARHVNDFTGKFLSKEEVAKLESKLITHDLKGTTQIAIVVVDTLGDYTAVDYATELGTRWGVGHKDKNNGVVILVSTGGGVGKRDLYMTVGQGLTSMLTDTIAKDIVQELMLPHFKTGNYYHALDIAIDAIIRAIEGKYKTGGGK